MVRKTWQITVKSIQSDTPSNTCVCVYTYTHIYILVQMIHIYDEQTWQKDWKEGIGEKGHHNNNKTPQQNLMLFHIVG